MTLDEIFKSIGLTDEQVSKIKEEMKNNKIFTSSEENLDLRYSKLKSEHDALNTKFKESENLIAELQKSTKNQEEIQLKITEYENTIEKQNEELLKAKTESELKFELLASGAKTTDVDYLIYKLKNSSDEWKPEINDEGKIKNVDDKIKDLKSKFPNQFETSSVKKFEEKKLEKNKSMIDDKISKEDFKKMGYKSRQKLKAENPDLYSELIN